LITASLCVAEIKPTLANKEILHYMRNADFPTKLKMFVHTVMYFFNFVPPITFLMLEKRTYIFLFWKDEKTPSRSQQFCNFCIFMSDRVEKTKILEEKSNLFHFFALASAIRIYTVHEKFYRHRVDWPGMCTLHELTILIIPTFC
jgi:hypothetical protein